jgi:hypothetical protein
VAFVSTPVCDALLRGRLIQLTDVKTLNDFVNGHLDEPLDGGDLRYVAIRPEDILVGREAPDGMQENVFPGIVAAVFCQGFTYEVHVRA